MSTTAWWVSLTSRLRVSTTSANAAPTQTEYSRRPSRNASTPSAEKESQESAIIAVVPTPKGTTTSEIALASGWGVGAPGASKPGSAPLAASRPHSSAHSAS